jgi:hypothetical protein
MALLGSFYAAGGRFLLSVAVPAISRVLLNMHGG